MSDVSHARTGYARSLSFSVLSFAASAVLAVVSSIILARLYGVVVFGELALLFAVLLLVRALSTLREQSALIRDLAVMDRRDPGITARVAWVTMFSVGSTAAVAVVVGAGAALLFIGPMNHPELVLPMIVLLANMILVDRVNQNLDAVFAAFRASRDLLIFRLVQPIVLLALAIGIGLERPILMGLVVATVASGLVATAMRLVALPQFMPYRVDRDALAEGRAALRGYLRFGLRAGPGYMVGVAADAIPAWTLASVGSLASLGAYSRAETITTRIGEGQWRINEMLYPTLIERWKAGDRKGFDRLLVDTVRIATTALLLVAAIGGGAATGIMNLFGPGFEEGAGALVVLLFLPAAYLVAGSQQVVFYTANRPLVTTLIGVVRLVTTIALCIVLTLWLGALGAALGLVAGQLFSVAIRTRLTLGFLSDSLFTLWPLRQLVGVVAAYLAAFIAAHLLNDAVAGAGGLVVALLAGSAVYVAVVFLVGGVNERDRERLSRILAARRARAAAPAIERVTAS